MKLYTRSDRTSCHRWEANQFRLFLSCYFLSNAFALRGSSCARSFWPKVARNPTELIAE
jgi:hypothetical protein